MLEWSQTVDVLFPTLRSAGYEVCEHRRLAGRVLTQSVTAGVCADCGAKLKFTERGLVVEAEGSLDFKRLPLVEMGPRKPSS